MTIFHLSVLMLANFIYLLRTSLKNCNERPAHLPPISSSPYRIAFESRPSSMQCTCPSQCSRIEAKTVELAPSGFDVKSFPRQSRSRGGGIATVYKSTLGSNITFKTSFDFTHTSFEVVQASITLQNSTLHFFCLYRPPPNRQKNLTDYVY